MPVAYHSILPYNSSTTCLANSISNKPGASKGHSPVVWKSPDVRAGTAQPGEEKAQGESY